MFSALFIFTFGFLQFENLPQVLHVGETEQLAVTFLLTTRYPTELVIPPRIKSLPVVLKNSFRFISTIVLLYGACYLSFQSSCTGCVFIFTYSFVPRLKPGATNMSFTRSFLCDTLRILCATLWLIFIFTTEKAPRTQSLFQFKNSQYFFIKIEGINIT